jgi:peptide/nickel transport system substrate-binding protein
MMSYRGQMGPGDHTYIMPAVEYLVEPQVDEKGNRGWTAFLCESYKIDPAAKTFTFNLRKNVKFHDGSVMNADVVKWNFQQQIDSGWLQDADKIVSIDTPDDSTVIIRFTEYSNQYEFNWGWTAIWSKQAWMAATGGDATTTNEKGIAWAVDHVVGTGPFKLKEYKRDVSISWEKFSDYWQKGKPYLDGLEFQIITEATTASDLLQAGDIDLWYQGNSAQDWAELAPKGYIVKTYWPGLPQMLMGNTVDPNSKWQDIRVREALEYALDKAPITKALGLGYYVEQPQVAPLTEWGYMPNLAVRKYDVVKAKQLLTDAGYGNGCPVKLMIQSVPASIDAGEALKGYLDAAGFQVELDIADPGRFFGSVFGTGWEDLVLMFYGMDVNYLATYMSWFSSDPKSNLASFLRTPEQIAMDKQAVLIPDAAGQMQMTADLCKYLYEQARLCPLWWVPAATVSAKYVHHEIYRHGFIRVDWENVWMSAH